MQIPQIDADRVITSVSNALRNFICAYIPQLASEHAVSFDSPAEFDGAGEDRLALYLYQIAINPELRNAPPTLSAEQLDPQSLVSFALTPAPLAVDLLYMVVVYGRSSEYEQKIAGSLVGLLDRCGKIPAEFVVHDSVLVETGNVRLSVVPQPATIHLLRDLWAGFPNKSYHMTKLYTVSPVRLPAPEKVPVDLVVEVSPVNASVTNPAEVQS
jgi:hypothetical protein